MASTAVASGKSTLAHRLAGCFEQSAIIHMDDFYKLPPQRQADDPNGQMPGGDYDIPRLKAEVILPLLASKPGHYYRNDWQSDELIDDGEIMPHGVIIVEGCYSLIQELRSLMHIKIFVKCIMETRLRRGLERDGEGALSFWQNWMAAEDRYITLQSPETAADYIIDGELSYD